MQPCQVHDPNLWFSERPDELEAAKRHCAGCRIRAACLTGALDRREPWGVWGGEIVDHGVVIAFKRPRGRPRRTSRVPLQGTDLRRTADLRGRPGER